MIQECGNDRVFGMAVRAVAAGLCLSIQHLHCQNNVEISLGKKTVGEH